MQRWRKTICCEGCSGAASVKPSGSVCEATRPHLKYELLKPKPKFLPSEENGMTLGTPIAMMVRNQEKTNDRPPL